MLSKPFKGWVIDRAICPQIAEASEQEQSHFNEILPRIFRSFEIVGDDLALAFFQPDLYLILVAPHTPADEG